MEAHLLWMLLLLLLLSSVEILLLMLSLVALVEGLRVHLCWSAHHSRRVLEHLIGHVKGAFLVDVVCRYCLSDAFIERRSLAYIYIPKTEHLVSLDLDLSLAVACGDRSSILLLLGLLLLLGERCPAFLLTSLCRTALLVQLGAIEVLCMRWWLTLTDRFCRLFLHFSTIVWCHTCFIARNSVVLRAFTTH